MACEGRKRWGEGDVKGEKKNTIRSDWNKRFERDDSREERD